jgi:hypothetical protein
MDERDRYVHHDVEIDGCGCACLLLAVLVVVALCALLAFQAMGRMA